MDESFSKILNRRYLVRSFLLFILFSFTGVWISFLWKEYGDFTEIWSGIYKPLLLSIGGFVLLDWLLGGYRIHIFAKEMKNTIKYRDCFRANMANNCLGGLTPSQTGGGVAQIYILYRAGLPISGGIALSVINMLTTLIIFMLGSVIVAVMAPHLFGGRVVPIIQYSFVVFSLVVAFFIICLFKPEFLIRLLRKIASWRVFYQRYLGRLLNRLLLKLEVMLVEYKQYTQFFIREKWYITLFSLIITIILYFNKFVVAYVIVRMLGSSAPFLPVIFTQILLIFIGYFAPTPGASGISEITATFFMASWIDSKTAPYFTLVWRFASIYLGVIIGGILLILQLRQDIRLKNLATER